MAVFPVFLAIAGRTWSFFHCFWPFLGKIGHLLWLLTIAMAILHCSEKWPWERGFGGSEAISLDTFSHCSETWPWERGFGGSEDISLDMFAHCSQS